MFRRVILHLSFPKNEIMKIASKLQEDLSIKYKIKNSYFYIGEVQDSWRENSKIIMILEVRKDETPAWYLKAIVNNALGKEILVMRGSDIVSKGGSISGVNSLNSYSDDEIIEPITVSIISG